jgi:prepilin-type N-terminal cleavage/methylation domain-containing protein/prepilin-type processing-associated H-X9-DG protein
MRQLQDDSNSSASRQPHIAAFTLIELLVVISIIALLISILLPALGSARKAANKSVCGSKHKQIMVAVYMYTQDHKGYLPPYRSTWINGSDKPIWQGLPQMGYIKGENSQFMGVCPGSNLIPDGSFLNVTLGINYNYNSKYGVPVWHKLDDMRKLTEHAFYACSRGNPLQYGQQGGPTWYRPDHMGYWHLDTSNVGYLDGHVNSVKFEDLNPGGASIFFLPWYD